MNYHDMVFPYRVKSSWWTRLWCNHRGWRQGSDRLGPFWCCSVCGKVIQSDEPPVEFVP